MGLSRVILRAAGLVGSVLGVATAFRARIRDRISSPLYSRDAPHTRQSALSPAFDPM